MRRVYLSKARQLERHRFPLVARTQPVAGVWPDIGRALGVVKNAKSATEVIEAVAAAKSELRLRMFSRS